MVTSTTAVVGMSRIPTGHSPGIGDNIRFSYAFVTNSTGEVDYDSPNIIYSYGKFQSKLITVKGFIIPSILEALNYDFYVGHVYGLS